MDFAVTILGSGSATPTANRGLTSQYIVCANRHLLIDCGEGTQMQMRRFGAKFQRIDYILISHLHGDHYFGLVGLLSTMHLLGRVQPIHIFAPKELEEILNLQLNYAGAQLSFPVHFSATQADEPKVIIEDEKIEVTSFPLSHKIPTTGFKILCKEKDRKLLDDKAKAHGVKIEYYHRLKKGEDITDENGILIQSSDYTLPGEPAKSYAFCSDTRYFEAILPVVSEVDLLYHEATFTEAYRDRAKATMHSTAIDAANIAKQAEVKKLIMGHISARYEDGVVHEEEARHIFQNSEVVSDGATYLV